MKRLIVGFVAGALVLSLIWFIIARRQHQARSEADRRVVEAALRGGSASP